MSIRTLSSRAVLVAALATGCASNKEVEHVETLRRDLASASAVTGSIKPQLPADVTLNKDTGRRSYLFVTISLETGEKLPFIVDTGSPVTFFRKSLEPKLGKRVGTIEVWSPGIGGMRRTKGGVFKAPQLFLGNTPLLTGSNVFTKNMTFQTLFARRRVQGILGMDCLRHYCIQLDFAAGKMSFLDSERLDVAQLGKAFPITFAPGGGLNGAPFIQHPGLYGGTGTNLLIDTGCHVDGFIEDGAIKAHGLGRVFSLFGRGRRVAECTWDGADYTKLHVRMIGQQNTLGLRMLARHLVTLDFPGQKMYLKQTTSGPLSLVERRTWSNKPDGANRRQPLGLRELVGKSGVLAFRAAVAHPERWVRT